MIRRGDLAMKAADVPSVMNRFSGALVIYGSVEYAVEEEALQTADRAAY